VKEVDLFMVQNVVLIGAGIIGECHLKAIGNMDGIRASAVADINLTQAQSCAERYDLKAYQDYRQMIDEVRPDIAIIALPHFLHKEAALYGLNNGCHLLLEKPMALNEAECKEIMEAAESNGRMILVGHTQQFLNQNLKAKALIRKGELGKLIMINDKRHGPYFVEKRPGWFLDRAKSGGGIVFNLGAHSIDKIQWLTDSRIVRVKANLSYLNESYPDIEGSASMLLETSTGVSCTVNLSGYEGIRSEETELVFEHGMIKIINHHSVWISKDGTYAEVPDEKAVDPFELQLLDLMDSIQTGQQPYASGEYAQSVVRVIEAVYESAGMGREVSMV
jgi:predicted dehydrogenase